MPAKFSFENTASAHKQKYLLNEFPGYVFVNYLYGGAAWFAYMD